MMRLEERLATAAARTPDQLAVDGAESITYRELDRLANRFAHTLRARGLERGARVGIHLPRSARAIAAMAGILRAGGVYVPLDPSSPAPRLELIAADSALAHVIISPALRERWLASGVGNERSFVTDVDAEDAPVASGNDPDELAYLLYTSGSTGVPKGVMISHRNALAFVDWAADLVHLDARDRVASVAPFHFDLSVFDIWSSITRGATICIVDEATVISGPRMVERIRSAAITVWYSVPTALVLLLDSGKIEQNPLPSLRTVIFAGEVFPLKQLRRAMAAIPAASFHNFFGPTETNVCTAYTVPRPLTEESALPIGRASCGDTIAVLDAEGKPVADGEIGELFIDGPTVMLGYWNGGARTPAKRPYPTGDLVSVRPDGELAYHGRRDHMVKVHGHRIELGEVETALAAHPLVREAIVTPHNGELVAVVVPTEGSLSILELKRHCAACLPKYMVPFGMRIVRELPRTSSGKTDRVRVKEAIVNDDKTALAPYEPPA